MTPVKHPIFNKFLGILLWIAIRFAGCLSTNGVRRTARVVARLIRIFYPRGVKLVRANIQTAFPALSPDEQRRIVNENLVSTVWSWLDFLRLLRHPDLLPQLLEEPDKDPAKEFPGQFILCLPHVNGWELFAQILPKYLPKAAAIAATIPLPAINEMLIKFRTATGLKLIPKEGALRKSISELRNGTSIGMLIDQNLSPRHGGIFVDFFGLPVPTSPAPVILSARMGIPLLTGEVFRNPDGKYTLALKRLETNLPQKPSPEEITKATQLILKANEAVIQRHPEQYSWFYRRWNSIPADVSPELAAKFPFYAKRKKHRIHNEEAK